MARLSYKRGCPVYFPDRIDVPKKVTLLPELSPMENLWRIIDMQVSVWLNWYKVFSISKEMMEELEQTARTVVFVEFRRRVLKGEYDRTRNLWMNLRSVCWSKMSHGILEPWFKRLKQLDNTVDGDEVISQDDHGTNTRFSLIPSHKAPRLLTDDDTNPQDSRTLTVPLESYKGFARKARAVNARIEDQYLRYLELCDEHGIQPIDKESWITDNISQEWQEIRTIAGNPDVKPKYGSSMYWSWYKRNHRKKEKVR
jgi:hypothetical protein